MDWKDCVNTNKVKKVQENPEQAKSLIQLARRRFESVEKRKNYEYTKSTHPITL